MVLYDVKDLDNCLSKYKSIIVYGIGNYGKAFIDYVIDIGQKKKIKSVVVTDRTNTPGEYRNILISEAGELFNQTVYEDTCVILAVSLRYQKSIITQLDKFGISNYYCLTDEIYRKIAEGGIKGMIVPYHGLTFLVAGFMKCGTTALHRVFMNIDRVYVPVEKETAYFSWFHHVNHAEEKLIKRYFSCIRKPGNSRYGGSVFLLECKRYLYVFWKKCQNYTYDA